MIFAHPHEEQGKRHHCLGMEGGVAGRQRESQGKGRRRLPVLVPEAVAGVAQTLLFLQANIFAQQDSVVLGRVFHFQYSGLEVTITANIFSNLPSWQP